MVLAPDDWSWRLADLSDSGDVEELARLQYEWRGDDDPATPPRDEFAQHFGQWIRAHGTTHVGFLGFLSDDAVAMGWLALVDRVPGPKVFVRRCGYVQSVFVRERCRRRGLGTLLVGALIDHAQTLGLDYLAVHPSELSFSMYRRLGFAGTPRVLEMDFRHGRSINSQ